MSQITPTQARYLSFILAYAEGFGVPPSEAEIAEAMKVQPPSVSGMLKMLVKKRLIERTPGKPRSIEILIDTGEIPPWKKKLRCNLKFYAPVDASPETLDEIGDEMIRQRKSQREKTKNKNATEVARLPIRSIALRLLFLIPSLRSGDALKHAM
jgi:SOS-response transcriptional repressor LexA